MTNALVLPLDGRVRAHLARRLDGRGGLTDAGRRALETRGGRAFALLHGRVDPHGIDPYAFDAAPPVRASESPGGARRAAPDRRFVLREWLRGVARSRDAALLLHDWTGSHDPPDLPWVAARGEPHPGLRFTLLAGERPDADFETAVEDLETMSLVGLVLEGWTLPPGEATPAALAAQWSRARPRAMFTSAYDGAGYVGWEAAETASDARDQA